jgi:mannose/fructose/N-acetylgalactosamine-specific phosphotransferase system component IIC
VLKRTLEWLAARLAGWRALALPPLITASAILATLLAVHLAIGTPEIAATIAVPWSASTVYAFVYSGVLARGRGAKEPRRA